MLSFIRIPWGKLIQLGTLSVCFLLNGTSVLWAQEDKSDNSEPMWVMSWILFLAFAVLITYLGTKSTKRRDSVLGEAEQKEVEERLAQRIIDMGRTPQK